MDAGSSSQLPGFAWDLLALNAVSLGVAVGALWLLLRQRRHGRALGAQLEQATTRIDTLVQGGSQDGLHGRAEFERALEDATRHSDRSGATFNVLYVDLDNLGTVNDAYGHEAGDGVLQQTVARLVEPAGAAGWVATRIVADEFALIVPGERQAGLDAAVRVARRLERPFAVHGHEVRLTCSIGLAGYPRHGARAQLLGHAALAMRSVKNSGGGGHAEYDPRMGIAQREQAELLHDLRLAVEHDELELYYQPKVDARSLQITAAEALLRWRHPQRGLIGPDLFVPLAERYGLIGSIGDWVIQEACRQAAAWREQGLRMRVAVNISGHQLRHDGLVDRIGAALAQWRLPAGRFTCEITESVAMEDTLVTQQAFERLRRAGVHVSIDDFGTGHSSLAALRRLPAAELKIDRAFVCDLEASADARSIVRAIVQMAHTLDLRVVAEGVETEAQRDLLVAIGCDELQGFLFARPMTAHALAVWAADEPADAPHTGAFSPLLFEETRAAGLDP
jgi:diguanylate cyclase